MYLDFFKFSRKPFNSAPDPDFFYLTPAARDAQDGILEAIHRREPCLLLSGEPGTGKTALLKRLMANSNPGIRWIFLNKAQLIWSELLIFIGQELGLPEPDLSSDHPAEAISEKIVEFANSNLYPVLVIDEADHIHNTTLRKLLAWHTGNQDRGVPLTIIFAGLETLTPNFASAGKGLFSEQTIHHCKLKRFDLEETRTVIAYRLELAGYRGKALFEEDALGLIQKLSGGIPRVINLICDLGLVLAATTKETEITPQIVQEASEYILLDRYPDAEKEPVEKEPQIKSEADQSPFDKKELKSESPSVKNPTSADLPPRTLPVRGWVAAVSLLLFLAGGATWLWLQPRSASINQENSRRLVYKVPLNIIKEGKKAVIPSLSATSPEIPPEDPHAVIVQGQTTSAPPSEKQPPVSPKTADIDTAKPPTAEIVKREGKTSVDTPTAAQSIVRDESAQPSPIQIAAVQKPPEVRKPAPLVQTEEPQEPIKRITPISPFLQMPTSSPKTDGDTKVEKTTRPSTPKPKEQKKPAVVNSPRQAVSLLSAVEKGDMEQTRRLLGKGTDVDSVNATGETALMKAAWAGNADILGLLLSHNPRIDRQSQEGWSALFYAAVKGHEDVVAALLTSGAKPDLADQDGRTPLMAACWNGYAEIARLLLKNGVNPNRKNRDGWTPLMFAALEGHIDIAEILLQGGANPLVKNNEGDTSAQLAAHQGHTQFLSLLSTHGQPN